MRRQLLTTLSLGCAAFLTLMACTHKPTDQAPADSAPPTPIEVAVAQSATLQRIVTAEAILYPVNQANIVPKVSAPVRRFHAERGDHVRQGQLLAELEDGDQRAATQESRQQYLQAQASLENVRSAVLPGDLLKAKTDVATAQEEVDAADKLYRNRTALLKEGAIAQKLVDDANVSLVQARSTLQVARQHLASFQAVGQSSQLRSAEAQVSAARDHYASNAAQSAYAEVRSPLSGVVADRGVNVGDIASTGATLFTIVDISRVVARANIPVNEAAALQAGQNATIKGPNGDYHGRVVVVSPAVDPNATTLQVWVASPNPGESLKIGSSVTVRIDAGSASDVVSVPAAALLAADEGGEKVMVASNGVAHQRSVTVGLRDGDHVQILSGVQAGESVIVNGALGLDDNAEVVIGKPEAAR